MFITWPKNVNQIVIDDAQLDFGTEALVTDTLENGLKRSRLSLTNPPDKFSFSMDFDWTIASMDADGLTEKDRFIQWYKYRHKFGSNPFQFPNIILGSENDKSYCYYTIEKATPGQKHGDCVRFKLTFKEYVSSKISIPYTNGIDHLEVTNGVINIVLRNVPLNTPSKDSFNIQCINENGETEDLDILYWSFDEYKTVKVGFTPLTSTNPTKNTITVSFMNTSYSASFYSNGTE